MRKGYEKFRRGYIFIIAVESAGASETPRAFTTGVVS